MVESTHEKQRIELDPIKIERVTIEIEGTSPLVVNAFSEKMRDEMEQGQTGQKTKSSKKRIRKPEEDFLGAIHFLDPTNAEVGAASGFPAVGIKAAMASAAIRFMDFKYKNEVYGRVVIPGELVEIQSEFPRMRRDTVRNSGMGRTADLRFRPEYWPWSMNVPIEFKSDAISLKQIVQMLAHAGFSVGLGEWRAEKGGSWGRFEVKSVS